MPIMNALSSPSSSRGVSDCFLCPRACGVSRSSGRGFCREGEPLRAAWAGLHFGEEPPVTAKGGSGTIFLTGCNLRCAFCQNHQISQEGMGAELTRRDFADICMALQRAGAENINIVTGSHAVPAVLDGVREAKAEGLGIPVCWNSSAYETMDAIDALAEVVDIWLPDMKTLNAEVSRAAFAAADYPEVASRAILRMAEHAPLRMASGKGRTRGKMLSGLILRHLVLPGRLADTQAVLDWFDAHLRGRAMLSLMTQYTPVAFGESEAKRQNAAFAVVDNRYLSDAEYDRLMDMLDARADENGFFQELVQDDAWLPDFSKVQPFSSELARGLWHWKEGWLVPRRSS